MKHKVKKRSCDYCRKSRNSHPALWYEIGTILDGLRVSVCLHCNENAIKSFTLERTLKNRTNVLEKIRTRIIDRIKHNQLNKAIISSTDNYTIK